MLVINRADHEGFVDLLEGYALPVLQDTEDVDVFSLYEARAYDLVAVGRGGRIDAVLHDVFPDGDRTALVALLVEQLL